jgi:hypothetical protein
MTPGGEFDRGFGTGGIATLSGANGHGDGVVLQPGGGIVTLGTADKTSQLRGLTASGAVDPGFHTRTLPDGLWWELAGRPDGHIDVLGTNQNGAGVLRVNAAGDPEPAFGSGGLVTVPTAIVNHLVPTPDGGVIVAGPTTLNPDLEGQGMRVARITAAGAVQSTATVPLTFGGGLATLFARLRAPHVPPLNQNSFRVGQPLLRPDGTLIVPGAVGVIQYTGEGAGYEHEETAVAAINAANALEPSFGGAATPARVSLRVPAQRARTDANKKYLRVLVNVKTSGPGLVELRVTAGGKLVAHSTAPAYAKGRQNLRALLTLYGRKRLRRAHDLPVVVRAKFRDLVGATASARGFGTLR